MRVVKLKRFLVEKISLFSRPFSRFFFQVAAKTRKSRDFFFHLQAKNDTHADLTHLHSFF